MQDQIFALEQLQSIDVELKEIENNLEKYPEEILNINNEIKNITESIADKKNSLEELEQVKSKTESQIQDNLNSIKKSEERLFEIKTHREYESLQKEIAEAKRNNSQLEDQILVKMEEIENLMNEISEEEKTFATQKVEYKEKIDEYELLIEDIKSREKPIKIEKAKILEKINKINSDILPIYEQVIKRNGKALALVDNEMCTGCNMNIPPQLYIRVLAQNEIHQCPNCKKILYSTTTKGE